MSDPLNISWSALKSFISLGGSQYIETDLDGSTLVIEAWNGPVHRICYLKAGSADHSEYVANYQADQETIFKQVIGMAQDDYQVSTRCLSFTATKNTTTYHYKTLDEPLALKGGVFFSDNSFVGDWINIQIVVKGATEPEDYLVNEFVKEALVWPKHPMTIKHDTAISGIIPAGLAIKVTYHSDALALVDPICGINFDMYREL